MQTVVDLSRLRHNIRRIRATLGNGFCAVVKADAYGHGLAAAGYIEPLVDCFLAATADEAIALASIVKRPILALGGDIEPYLRACESNIIPTVTDANQLTALLRSGRKCFSVAVNTGMNRLGASESKLAEIAELCKLLNVKPWSVYSHLYGGIASAAAQSAEFERLTADGLWQSRRHLYCSCALDLAGAGVNLYDMTRCGIAMYGYAEGLDICMKVRAKIVAISRVQAGEHIGYGDYTLDRDAVIATVRIGYADGLRRCDKQLYLRVRGNMCPVIGVPCMDYCMIDVSGIPCRVGEYAYLISEKSDTEYLAKCYGTIIYEVLTGFNGRAERVYV